jgi:uncharacterized protein GlcG (DUF336 family)
MTQLTNDDVKKILDQAETAARKELSLLRVSPEGKPQKTKMHIAVVDRAGRCIGQRSMQDAWVGSIHVARAKAFTAAAFSSNENALSTRSIGILSQPGAPLWQLGNSNIGDGVIEFPGGIPLYKDAILVGAIGVSGDGVEQDENVAELGAKGFETPVAIRVDTVTKNQIAYIK